MTSKRPCTGFIGNPLVKKRNLQWTLEPPLRHPESGSGDHEDEAHQNELPHSTAAIEAGAVHITNHLARFSAHLASHALLHPRPLVPVSSYASLYTSNADTTLGAHFVIHQHDHPVAGTHYDLRLQINPTSSVSWAIMYGLPGDPNSIRLNRNATETRIHSLWNHLIETASADTGSLLIWDTGTFTVLPRRSKHAPAEDPASQRTSPSSQSSSSSSSTQQSLLEAAFHSRKIRLRLRGSKLPDPYVLNIRLTRFEDAQGRAKSKRTPRQRRRRYQQGGPEAEATPSCSSDEGDPNLLADDNEENLVPKGKEVDRNTSISALDRELREVEDEQVRQTNAYPGADNTIGSIHQRKWYLSLDRRACGFVPRRQGNTTIWQLPGGDSSTTTSTAAANEQQANMQRLAFPFYVRGVPHERSVVTARRGEDIMLDEDVCGFIPRKGWMPVLN